MWSQIFASSVGSLKKYVLCLCNYLTIQLYWVKKVVIVGSDNVQEGFLLAGGRDIFTGSFVDRTNKGYILLR